MEELVELNKRSEEQLSALICALDDNPVLKSNKTSIEEVSYLGFQYFHDSEDFRDKIIDSFHDFTVDIHSFTRQNEFDDEFNYDIVAILNSLLNKYQNAHKQFIISPLRKEWKTLYQSYWLPNLHQTYDFHGKEKRLTDIYEFFYGMSSIQLEFIESVISYLTSELQLFKDFLQYIPPADNIISKDLSLPIYVFKITKQESKKSHLFLSKLHKELKSNGYVDCILPEFKQLFINYSDVKPISSPTPIIWKCVHYNHLAYFIKCLTERQFITSTKHPSNYQIALNLFNDRMEGNFYSPKKPRYDGNLNPKDKENIDSIIEKALLNSR